MINQILKWWKRILAVPFVRFLVDVFDRFGNDNGYFFAAGLSFFMLLSFAPIILTGVAVLGSFIDVHTATVKISVLIENLLPAGGARLEAMKFLSQQLHIEDEVKSVVSHRGIAGFAGFLSLLWTTIQIFVNAATPMNAMWEVKETRSWIKQRLLASGLTLITGCLVVLSIVLSGAPIAISKFQLPVIHHLPIPLGALTVIFEVVALIFNSFMYVVIYKLLPNEKVSWPSAVFGGVIASLFFEIAKKSISSYLLRANHSVYGDLANMILFILWIYYSMIILLLGAEFAAGYSRWEQSRSRIKTKGAEIRMRARQNTRRKQPATAGNRLSRR